MPMVFGSALTLATFLLIVVVAHFSSWDHSLFLKKMFPKFRFGVMVSISSMVRFEV